MACEQGLKFKALTLWLTWQCNIQCRLCCGECGPERTERMPLQDALEYIRQAAAISDIRVVSLTGGEPFLCFETLQACITQATANGLASWCTTNGFWALDPSSALKWLEPLKTAGLACLELSMDSFHQEFIPLDRIKNVLDAARQLDVNVNVQCTVTRTGRRIWDYLAKLDGQAMGFALYETACVPTGRAAQSIPPSEWIRTADAEYRCRYMNKLAVTPDGQVYPCCSPGSLVPPLVVGSAQTENLSAIAARICQTPFFRLMRERGPGWLRDRLQEEGQEGLEDCSLPVDACHLCYQLLSVPARANAIQAIVARQS